jgi:hypothetical protein
MPLDGLADFAEYTTKKVMEKFQSIPYADFKLFSF